MIRQFQMAFREPLSMLGRAYIGILSRYLAALFLLLFLSKIPMPIDKHALALLALAALVGNVLFHILLSFTGRTVLLSYIISVADLFILSAAIHLTGMLRSPILPLIPILFFAVYFIAFNIRLLVIFASLASVIHLASLILWLEEAHHLIPWSPSEFPIFVLAIGMLLLYNMLYFLYYATVPDPLVEELSRQEAQLSIRARQAELGSSLIMIATQFQPPLASLSRSISRAGKIARQLARQERPGILAAAAGCHQEARRIGDMLKSVTAYARNRHGKYRFSPCPIGDLLARAIEFAHLKHGRHHAHYSLDPSLKGSERILCDEDAFYQVLINLLDNAIANREPRRPLRLEISFFRRIRTADLIIRDNGKGMPAGEVPYVFELFRTSRSTGIGLGLPIVRQVIREHGGNVWISSVEGVGTTVTVSLPLGPRQYGPTTRTRRLSRKRQRT